MGKKSSSLIVRLTEAEKLQIHRCAADCGTTASNYVLKAVENSTIINPKVFREVLCEMHRLHLALLRLEQQGASIQEMQDAITALVETLKRRAEGTDVNF